MSVIKKSYWRKIYLFDNFFKSIVLRNRKDFFEYFCKLIKFDENTLVLDVGTTPSLEEHENYFIKLFPYKSNLTCLSNVDCSKIKIKFKEVKLIKSDARASNLGDNKFDVIHSNAVIEHVGDYQNQKLFIKECYRISKKYVFITTPYRYFPIEMHTKIPLIHFFPKAIFRKILSFFGDNFFSLEENLNLLSIKDLNKILRELNIKNYKIIKKKFLFFTSNLILVIKK